MCLVLALILFSQDDCIFIPSAITGRNIYHTGPAILNHSGPGASKKYQIQILRALTPSRLIPFWSNSKIDLFLAPSGYQECPSALHILIFEYWCRWAVSVSMHVIPEVNFPKKANYNFSPDSESPPRLSSHWLQHCKLAALSQHFITAEPAAALAPARLCSEFQERRQVDIYNS